MQVFVSVDGKQLSAHLQANETSMALSKLLPLHITMDEMNGNEKYYFFDKPLPNSPEPVGQIHSGDIMLWGSNCLVIFFKDFQTSYQYTKLGKIDQPEQLATSFGPGQIQITLTKQ